jgi:hypothetical protein
MARQKYKYAAGIGNKRGDWEWQGYVIAYNINHAKKLLTKFKKRYDIKGKVEFAPKLLKEKTSLNIGVLY